jgi:hypothetical protein
MHDILLAVKFLLALPWIVIGMILGFVVESGTVGLSHGTAIVHQLFDELERRL